MNGSERVVRGPATGADLELFRHIENHLYTAVVSDSLDELGYRDQAFREFMRPLSPEDCFAGWARTLAAWIPTISRATRTRWRSRRWIRCCRAKW